MTDGRQNEVYATARQLADEHGYKSIVDFGTGSGYKLVKHFPDPQFTTLGIDLAPAAKILNQQYPERLWSIPVPGTFLEVYGETDLLICSDVIEHVDDPDALCESIKRFNPKHIVISTPDKTLVCKHHGQPELGPPRNTTHVREWTFSEFGDYMRSHFNVERCGRCAQRKLAAKGFYLLGCRDVPTRTQPNAAKCSARVKTRALTVSYSSMSGTESQQLKFLVERPRKKLSGSASITQITSKPCSPCIRL